MISVDKPEPDRERNSRCGPKAYLEDHGSDLEMSSIENPDLQDLNGRNLDPKNNSIGKADLSSKDHKRNSHHKARPKLGEDPALKVLDPVDTDLVDSDPEHPCSSYYHSGRETHDSINRNPHQRSEDHHPGINPSQLQRTLVLKTILALSLILGLSVIMIL